MTGYVVTFNDLAFGQRPPNKEDAKTAAEKLGFAGGPLCGAKPFSPARLQE
jgi:hypothetical protein